jgi:hypothetical protein
MPTPLRTIFTSPNGRSLLLGLVLLVIVVICILGLKKLEQQDTANRLMPDADSIATMTVSRVSHQGSDMPRFVVPREHIPAILDSLKVQRVIDQRKEPIVPWVGLGLVEIETLAGEKVSISVYRTNLPVGEFSVVRGSIWEKCRGGNSEQFANAVVAAYGASRKSE